MVELYLPEETFGRRDLVLRVPKSGDVTKMTLSTTDGMVVDIATASLRDKLVAFVINAMQSSN